MRETGEINSTFTLEPDPPTPTQDHPAVGNMDLMDDFFHLSQCVKIQIHSEHSVNLNLIT